MALEMVGGVFVSMVVQELLNAVTSYGYDQFRHVISDVEKKLRSLEISYTKAQSMLDNADGWELISSKPHREWVGDMRRACYDVEDLVVDVMVEMRKAKNSLSFLRKWVMSREIDEQQTVFDGLMAIGSNFVTLDTTSQGISRVVKESVIRYEPFQRQQEKEEIIKMLSRLHSSVSSSRSSSSSSCAASGIIILIQGMFGLGKTLLVHEVQKDSRIQDCFDQIFWVPVSGEFDLAKTLESIVIHTSKVEQDEKPPSSLINAFKALCHKKRVLIVLDDLGSLLTAQDWEEFQSLLVDTALVFRVLITTRSLKVMRMVTSLGTTTVIRRHLKELSKEDCQSIILGRISSSASVGGHTIPSKRKRCAQEEIAFEMAEKFCKGLPLVANAIRLHLSSVPEHSWSAIMSRDLWDIPVFKEQIFPALKLNCTGLSQGLKNCFCYLSLFSNNFLFNRNDLVRCWMAEGFLVQGTLSDQQHHAGLEEIGNDWFDELLSRSIITFDHERRVYKLHEFIHQYAEYVGSDIYIRIDNQFVDSYSSLSGTVPSSSTVWYVKARHISFVCPMIMPSILKDIERCRGLRTLAFLSEHTEIKELGYGLFSKLRSLRLLNLSRTEIAELPGSIGNLKLLRLLDVSGTNIEQLPASITKLTGLQVLKLTGCDVLELPRHTKNMTSLLHLEADIKRMFSMPHDIGKLINLRTLPAFIVGDGDGFRITELKNMLQLRGSLCITNLENATGEDATNVSLSNKKFIKSLELEWIKYLTDKYQEMSVLNELVPHRDLEELKIIGYGGPEFPSWLSRPECRLTHIHLQRCHRCDILPPLGQLPYLKSLHIQELSKVEYVDDNFFGAGAVSNFPALELLIFEDMARLQKWSGSMKMPRLHDLRIIGCPELCTLPSLYRLACLVNLEIRDCVKLQSLPEGIMPLSLKQLILEGSDLLQQSCLPKDGADWEKIHLVPRVVIDFVSIKTLTSYTLRQAATDPDPLSL